MRVSISAGCRGSDFLSFSGRQARNWILSWSRLHSQRSTLWKNRLHGQFHCASVASFVRLFLQKCRSVNNSRICEIRVRSKFLISNSQLRPSFLKLQLLNRPACCNKQWSSMIVVVFTLCCVAFRQELMNSINIRAVRPLRSSLV